MRHDGVGAPLLRRTRLADRVGSRSDAWPFGVGLRRTSGSPDGLPFPTWAYAPAYVPAGTTIPVGRNSENLGEPLIFLLPWKTEPGWKAAAHPNGARRVTRAELVLVDSAEPSEVLRSLRDLGVVEIAGGPSFLMEVELDGGGSGRRLDLRPEVPLVLVW